MGLKIRHWLNRVGEDPGGGRWYQTWTGGWLNRVLALLVLLVMAMPQPNQVRAAEFAAGRALPADLVPHGAETVFSGQMLGNSGAAGWWQPVFNRIQAWQRAYRPLLIGLGICLIMLFLNEQVRKRQRQRVPRDSGTNGWFPLPRLTYLFLIVLVLVGGLLWHDRNELIEVRANNESLREKIDQLVLNQYRDAFARDDRENPIPIRPQHPKRLGGSYYRGNDERSPHLFNGGFYQTAEFEVFLADENQQSLEWDAEVPSDRLWLGVRIKRAAKSTPVLFADNIMSTVFLTRQTASPANPVRDTPVPFKEEMPQQQWSAFYEIATGAELSDGTGTIQGMIYLYVGDSTSRPINAICHYAIKYEINLENGKIAQSSEIWMGPVYLPKTAVIAGPQQIALSQWFDFRPIPQIEEQTTTDPELLGIQQPDGKDD